jgi:pimeloyl-ACP methyl ester carboxylesterase
MYRNLIPLLSQKYCVVAPDFPGFGFTTVSPDYEYTFANMATTLGEFLDALNIKTFSMYIFDYGAPIGLRLALQRPQAVRALITQNGNAYLEGVGEVLVPITKYWMTGSAEDREVLRQGLLSFDAVKSQYENGTTHPERIAPETWTLDHALMSREGNQEIQLDLFKDYETNVQLYPKFQEWFRNSQVPTLIAWGKNDLLFVQPGAEAYKRDLPNAEFHLLDAGHFAGETETQEIGRLILEFLGKNGI